MENCSKDIICFHDAEVTLPQPERTSMRDRRDSNRQRLNSRLLEDGKSKPTYIKQGSYAMLTMVQDANNDYDIDDGVYFTEDQIDGKSPKGIRDYICEKLGDDRFNKQPKSKKSIPF